MHPYRRRSSFFLLFLFIVVSQWYSLAFGADSSKVNIALLGGLSFPSLSSGAFTYGVKLDYRLSPNLQLGFYYIKYSIGLETDSGASTIIANTSDSIYGLEGLYNLSSGFSFGLRLGLTHVAPNDFATDSVNTLQLTSSSTSLSFAPTLVYDYPVGSFFAVGADVSYFFALGGDAPNVITLLGQAKLFF